MLCTFNDVRKFYIYILYYAITVLKEDIWSFEKFGVEFCVGCYSESYKGSDLEERRS